MQVTGKVVFVTGGANGIGKALCEAFHGAGAAKIVVTDIDGAGARAVAAKVNGAAFQCDVAKEKDILHVIDETERQFDRAWDLVAERRAGPHPLAPTSFTTVGPSSSARRITCRQVVRSGRHPATIARWSRRGSRWRAWRTPRRRRRSGTR